MSNRSATGNKIKRIILTHHTHTDIGYTGIYPQVAVQHMRHLRLALDMARREPCFHWTIEAGWPLEIFLQNASAAEKTALAEGFKRGQFELTAFYNQPLTQLCNLEELCSTVEANFRLAEGLNARIDTAMINDIGGMSYNAPQILNYYGVKNVVNGCGGWRVMLPYTNLPHLFRLTGPDDSSVLYYHLRDDIENFNQSRMCPAQYGFGILYFLWPILSEIDGRQVQPGNDNELRVLNLKGRAGIDEICSRLEQQGYPYDVLLLQTGTDNAGPDERLPEALDEWNRRYGTPEIVIGTCSDFFREIEARYGSTIPVVKGELTCSWTEHAVANAWGTGHYRQARRHLLSWSALESCRPHPAGDNRNTWWTTMRDLLLYSDHTNGISMWGWQNKVENYGSLQDQVFDLPRRSWEIKTAYANEAYNRMCLAGEAQFTALAGDAADKPAAVSIFNPHSFVYNGNVGFYTAYPSIKLIGTDGTALPVETKNVNGYWYLHKSCIKGLPAYGVSVCKVQPASEAETSPAYTAGELILQGPGISVIIDAGTGAVSSITTEGRTGDWVDPSMFHLNDIVYSEVTGLPRLYNKCGLDDNEVEQHQLPLTEVKCLGSSSGVISASMLVERRLESRGLPVIVETQYILDASGLHIRNRIKKIHTLEKESCYFAFPFRMQGEYRFDIEQHGQTTAFPDERLPGATNHNFGMQDFISVSDDSSQVVLCSDQACLAALGKPSYYHFGLDYQDIETSTVFSYAFNNLWNTNCALMQQGELTFDYHLAFLHHGYS
ncbi:MAG: hypothetical protein PHT33_02770, partial [bacterium]|nr:hypothetical protein [bacterium]